MTDSTGSTNANDEFSEFVDVLGQGHMNLVAAEQETDQQHVYLMSLLVAQVARSLPKCNSSQLEALKAFIANDCEFEQVIIVDNDDDSTELEKLRASLAIAERERDELKADIEDSKKGCEFHMDLKTKKNLSDSIGIFSKLSNGNGGFVSNWAQVIDAGFEKIREDAKRSKSPRTMPKSPPVTTDTSDKGKPKKQSLADLILGK